MRKPIPTALLVTFSLFIKATRLRGYALIAIVCLTGCTATVVRWNSVRMREEIMAYYNDEIMDNLIKLKEGLPFVHVDISSVSAQGISQVSGTVAGGDTESFTRTSPSMIGALHTISRVATAPFTYSVTPLHNDTLTMTAVPVIGPLPADSQTQASEEEEEFVKTKVTEVRAGPEGPVTQKTTEKVPKPAPTTTIYDIYKCFLCKHPNALMYSQLRPTKNEVVPGTLKRRDTGFYYIRNNDRAAYTCLCETLFTQSRGKPAGKTLKADVEVLKAQGIVPPTPRQP